MAASNLTNWSICKVYTMRKPKARARQENGCVYLKSHGSSLDFAVQQAILVVISEIMVKSAK